MDPDQDPLDPASDLGSQLRVHRTQLKTLGPLLGILPGPLVPDLFLFTAAKNYGHKLYITKENKERLGLFSFAKYDFTD